MANIFIDGQAGTTGLHITERLEKRNDLKLLQIKEADRKNQRVKKEVLNEADLVVLCLPDEAAKESHGLIENPKTRILDASSAHRTDPEWVYGLPELGSGQREKIITAQRVSNPGCYPTGFILLTAPLRKKELLSKDHPITVQGISGFSGGGRKLIEKFETVSANDSSSWSFRPYGFSLDHKHLPEMKKYAHLDHEPVFLPGVANLDRGLLVLVPLALSQIRPKPDLKQIHQVLSEAYQDETFIKVFPLNDQSVLSDGFLSAGDLKGTNRVELFVFGNVERAVLVARLDNLGKGASGAAIQNINLMLGINESTGLI
ncbi:MAG: N-acetyl-gamma-glutamyl-phosphate reductase [Deltaproteobacteria bacterium]|nr:N-acetyl-gamma-glutamyl-phosphate reductase [Deltaproteobacteria bacterium]